MIKQFTKALLTASIIALPLAITSGSPALSEEKKEFKVCWSIYVGWMPWGYLQDSGIMKKWADKYEIDVEIVQINDYVESINQYTAGEFDACSMTNMDGLSIPAGGGVDTIVEALNSAAVTDLRRQQTNLIQRKAVLMTRYGERHPEVQRVNNEEADLDRQISAELRRIVSSLEQDVLISRERVSALQTSLNSYKSELTDNNQDAVELAELLIG